jgi:lipoate-protein ligase B
MSKSCMVHHLGLVPYEEAWQLQDRIAREIAAGQRPPTLLLLEHPHTYTFGRSGKAEHLLWDEAQLSRRGVSVQWVDRGGDVTYHGPGQLVGYPLLPLGAPGVAVEARKDSSRLPTTDFLGYLRNLERLLIAALEALGVTAVQVAGLTGVWVETSSAERLPAKIAAIGVKVDARGITRHGFALNVDPDMDYWQGIVGCGLEGYPVTSLSELLDPAPAMAQVRQAVVQSFGETFGYEMQAGEVSRNPLEPVQDMV